MSDKIQTDQYPAIHQAKYAQKNLHPYTVQSSQDIQQNQKYVFPSDKGHIFSR